MATKFDDAFPLTEGMKAVFLEDKVYDELSEDDRKANDGKVEEAMQKSLDLLIEWKSHFPAAVVEAIGVLSTAIGQEVSEEEGDGDGTDAVEKITCVKCSEVHDKGVEKCTKCGEAFPEDTPPIDGMTQKAMEMVLGKVKGLMTSMNTAITKVEEDLASKMLRAAKGEDVQLDDILVELDLEDGKKTTIPAVEFIETLKQATTEVLEEGAKDAA